MKGEFVSTNGVTTRAVPARRIPISMPPLSASVIGRRIVAARKALGWTREDLSRVARIPRPTITGYETGHSVPMRDQSIRLALALELSLDWLLMGRRSAVVALDDAGEASVTMEGERCEDA